MCEVIESVRAIAETHNINPNTVECNAEHLCSGESCFQDPEELEKVIGEIWINMFAGVYQEEQFYRRLGITAEMRGLVA